MGDASRNMPAARRDLEDLLHDSHRNDPVDAVEAVRIADGRRDLASLS